MTLETMSASAAFAARPARLARTVLVLALVALASAPPRPADLGFAPEEGSELSATYAQRWLLELEDQEVRMVVDGEEVGGHPEVPEITIETRDELTFAIEVLAVEGGRVVRLLRTLEEVEAVSTESARGADGSAHDEERVGETELEGVPVQFDWDPDEEVWLASFGADADVDDDDLLEDLEGEDVLVAFLGPEDAEEGDSWDVDLDAFRRLSNPGGDLKIVKEGDAPDQAEFEAAFYDNLEGEIRAEHRGLREVDGLELVVVALELELETEVERARDGESTGAASRIEETFVFRFDLEGELLWDVAAGHARALDLEGSLELDLSRVQSVESPEREIRVEMDQEFAGSYAYEARID